MSESFESARPVSPIVGRSLPNSQEAEEYLLSCCLMDGSDAIPRCIMAAIAPTNFYDTKHQIVFEVLLDLYREQKPTEIWNVAEELKTRKLLDQVGGYGFLTQVSNRIPTTAQTSFFIEKVKEQSILREIIRACTGGVEDCYGYTGGMDEFTTRLTERITKATGRGATTEEETFQSVANRVAADLAKEPEKRNISQNDVSWGLIDIDKACGKMPAGGLVILAGMPSTGKSALADRIAWQNAQGESHVFMFTFEMTKDDKVIRIAQQESRVNFKKMDEAPIDMKMRFITAAQRIGATKTLHVFENDKTIARISARCKNFAQNHKIGLIVVDFLQYLARLEPTIGHERSDEKIGRLTGELKQIAKSCACPVLCLSSLNRSAYGDGNRPTMAGLKGSGEIESDADQILILHWPATNPVTGEDQDPHNGGNEFYVEANQDKGRGSGVHQVILTFHRDVTLFSNYTA